MLGSLINTLTQAAKDAWTWINSHIFPFLVSPLSKEEYALLRRVSTVFQMSIALCLVVTTGAAEMTSVIVLTFALIIGLYLLSSLLKEKTAGQHGHLTEAGL